MKIREGWSKIMTIDMHTGGEPLRIFSGGLPEIHGNSILEKRRYFHDHLDHIRRGTMWEPRGHADMYGAVITEPLNEGSDFGVFFLHNEGYSSMCGHAIIALTKYVLEMGLIKKEGDRPVLQIDTPAGLVTAKAFRKGEDVEKVSFMNVPSFLLLKDEEVKIDGLGDIRFDVAYGGAFYAFCEAEPLGLKLDGSHYYQLIDAGKKIRHAVMEQFTVEHPLEEELSFLYGTIFIAKPHDPAHHSRNVCIFADGEVDRSATGSGVSARAALHHAKGELAMGEKITIESILGTTMDVEIKKTLQYGPHDAVIPEVSGTAFFTGRNEFWFDPDDPLREGFIFS